MDRDDERIRRALGRLIGAGGALAGELQDRLARARPASGEPPTLESFGRGPAVLGGAIPEAIALRAGRPVLKVAHGRAVVEFTDDDSAFWRSLLESAAPRLETAVAAVGRIDVERHPQLAWIGTGVLVAPDVVATNRHVAVEFARHADDGVRFRAGVGGPRAASIDFLEEFGRDERLAFRVVDVIDLGDEDGPDLALLRVEPGHDGRALPAPASLETAPLAIGHQVAVVGYPARDGRVPDQALMERIFGRAYDHKRLAPGEVRHVGVDVQHDCSTLPGNSGSAVIALATGRVVGLHYAGRFLEANFAVPSARIAERLAGRRTGRRPPPTPPARPSADVDGAPGPTDARRHLTVTLDAAGTGRFTLPLEITVALGVVRRGDDGRPSPGDGRVEDLSAFAEAASVDALQARGGYDPAFLAPHVVPLPTFADDRDVLTFQAGGQRQSELRYEHFSVVMSKARRMCSFSAVNIDGRASVEKTKRAGWRMDPRIPRAAQILQECYGDPPRFSRGHMTRREDPAWGPAVVAERGNADSMHVTNTVPQMQPFNGGVWLSLEDYALKHARRDDQRVSVITGPFFRDDDPTRHGVRIPVEFWKVIAFVHDETGALCATGYRMSQEKHLADEEFVFGPFETAQCAIRTIEAGAGLTFGSLHDVDPFVEEEGVVPPALERLTQIRFLRRKGPR